MVELFAANLHMTGGLTAVDFSLLVEQCACTLPVTGHEAAAAAKPKPKPKVG
jgi:hypothetical protein